MTKVGVKELALAAFMKANGAQLIGYQRGAWVFGSVKTMADWRLEYTNSCCRKHDLELLELRRIARGGSVDTL